MKIVFLIDQVYLHGGIERVLSIKANYLAKNDANDIHIITTEQQQNSPCYDFNSAIHFLDLGINYSRNKSYFHPKNLLKLPIHISKIKHVLKQIQPDVVVVCSHSTDTYFMPFIAKHIPKVKEFHYSKSIEVEKRKNPKSTFKKQFLKFADYVETKYDSLVVLNKDEQAYYASNNTTVIPNPLTFFPETKTTLEKKIVIAAGRIAQVKGFDLLIDIWALFAQQDPQWQLHIYGDGPKEYVASLQKQIDANNLSEVVLLKGSTTQVKKKMLDASIYAMTSHNECFPLVLLEAQACGLPIVAYNCPHGPSNIVSKENGILVEHYNKEQFAEALLKLSRNKDLLQSMSTEAVENAKKYTIEKVMSKWINLFTTLKK
ncbi:glycosyltransferase involved in cell wall biosynthesis [Cellulophaga sp. RHA_52]|uniref:glycosyltransferase family 4 protein n=1 Tax=Cellulophaga sp. RHA_52 TaxID=1250036 RepID=UPI00119B0F67|nr:glycosyltransferase family 4 protein [Cellulophaga sp. RHA_52]TVZ10237.1 glycosyltransferase involved in cell wall biosynthesis [Cellulophaga sp. RHA_52]